MNSITELSKKPTMKNKEKFDKGRKRGKNKRLIKIRS